jgi:AP-1-like factor
VKDLETKLNSLESSTTSLASDNQTLKLALQRAVTENEILRATRGSKSSLASLNPMRGFSAPESAESNMDEDSDSSSPEAQKGKQRAEGSRGEDAASRIAMRSRKRRISKPLNEFGGVGSQPQGPVLTSNALWDFLIEHPLVSSGQVDIADACDRIRGLARPGSHGPIFYEAAVSRAIESSRRGGGDALI